MSDNHKTRSVWISEVVHEQPPAAGQCNFMESQDNLVTLQNVARAQAIVAQAMAQAKLEVKAK